ncbi:MAG TPA: rhodanese-like domain-containing protein, partial [Microbacterium sp.]|uniref:rhodanese-like domain-containing protein n=1 Tax=Microbacterium sp. TaxID=51671 RepID=UPI002CBAA593
EPLLGRVLVIDALRSRQSEVPLRGSGIRAAARPPAPAVSSVSVAHVVEALASDRPPVLLDVREPAEVAAGAMPGVIPVPLAALLADPAAAVPPAAGRSADGPIVMVCEVGVRARRAAEALVAAGIPATVLAGGMVAWRAFPAPQAQRSLADHPA